MHAVPALQPGADEAHIGAGGKVLVSLAGALSTAGLGRMLRPAIEQGLVHAISTTGANLEEDAFRLLAEPSYEEVQDWRALSADDEKALYERGMNRVTDTCIPETVMRHLEGALLAQWQGVAAAGDSMSPAGHLLAVLSQADMQDKMVAPEESWLLAAGASGVPVFTPGFLRL